VAKKAIAGAAADGWRLLPRNRGRNQPTTTKIDLDQIGSDRIVIFGSRILTRDST
jgi:hypothetical protein